MFKVYTSDKIISSEILKNYKEVSKWVSQFMHVHAELEIPLSDLRVKEISSGKVFNISKKGA